MVQLSKLEELLQRCPDCGSVPGREKPTGRIFPPLGRGCQKSRGNKFERKKKKKRGGGKLYNKIKKYIGEPRKIKWTRSGSCVIAHWNCSCQTSRNERKWEAQELVGETKIFSGNIVMTTAARVSPIEYNDLYTFCLSANIPFVGKSTFLSYSNKFAWEAIERFYTDQVPEVKPPIKLAADATYDSPGHNAMYASTTVMDVNTKLVIGCEITRKDEVGGVSNRMELKGLEKMIDKVEAENIEEITIDKHLSVVKMLKNRKIKFFYDPWHQLKTLRRKMRKTKNKIKNPEDKKQFDQLSKRLYKHIYYAIDKSQGDKLILKDIVLSFFLHVCGYHNFDTNPIAEQIYNLCPEIDWKEANFDPRKTKQGKTSLLQKEKFYHQFTCTTIHNQEDITLPILPTSVAYIQLYQLIDKNFLTDLEHYKHGNITSHVESVHNIIIKFRPKKKFFSRLGFIYRTMLAVISYNENVRAELRGERYVVYEYRCYSRSKGEYTIKRKKQPAVCTWQPKIVDLAVEICRNGMDEPEFDEDDINDGASVQANIDNDVWDIDDEELSEDEEEEVDEDGDIDNLNEEVENESDENP